MTSPHQCSETLDSLSWISGSGPGEVQSNELFDGRFKYHGIWFGWTKKIGSFQVKKKKKKKKNISLKCHFEMSHKKREQKTMRWNKNLEIFSCKTCTDFCKNHHFFRTPRLVELVVSTSCGVCSKVDLCCCLPSLVVPRWKKKIWSGV